MGATGGASVAVGDLVDGKYRIIQTIGEGGWGVVFEGENIRTFKRVAIKILRPHSGVTKDILIRFEREAQAAGRIGSEHIVEVYDLGSLGDGTHYMVMELLSGEEFANRIRNSGPLDPVVVTKIMLQLLDGLKAAHDAGIQHRDLKPENLFLVPTRSGEEFVKILDFGISKFNNGPQTSATMTGAVLGSPCYMAPEQARGLKQIDARTDLYAVGTLMFESLTGRVPFEGDNFNDLMFKIVLAPRPDPRELRPDLDADMAAIVVKAMAIEPKERFQSAAELSAALVDWLASKGISSVRPPELKRAAYRTPRTTRDPNSGLEPRSGGTPVEKATVRERGSDASRPQWSDATMPAEPGAETPIVSSSSGVRVPAVSRGSRKRLIALAAVAGAVIVVAAGGVMLARGPHAGTVIAAPVDPPSTIGASAAATSSPLPTASLAPPEIESSTPTEVASAAASAAPAHTAVRGFSRFGPLPKATAAPPPPPKPTEVAPPPPATAAAPAKPVSTVEGREIRTGL